MWALLQKCDDMNCVLLQIKNSQQTEILIIIANRSPALQGKKFEKFDAFRGNFPSLKPNHKWLTRPDPVQNF